MGKTIHILCWVSTTTYTFRSTVFYPLHSTPSGPIYKRKLGQQKLMYLDWILNRIHQLLLTQISLINRTGGSIYVEFRLQPIQSVAPSLIHCILLIKEITPESLFEESFSRLHLSLWCVSLIKEICWIIKHPYNNLFVVLNSNKMVVLFLL